MTEARDDERDALAKAMWNVPINAITWDELSARADRDESDYAETYAYHLSLVDRALDWMRNHAALDAAEADVRAALRVYAALEAAGYRKHPEPEWEYGVDHGAWSGPVFIKLSADLARAEQARSGGALVRRVAAGPWVPIGEGVQ